ncbi:MAG: hypothetical protein OEW12_10390 [Deltaproteobacteria bacterium]|nr:hypothetical protein [Deltaproteobacteria bacterium]
MNTLSDILKARVQSLGFDDIKDCARELDIPYELFRKVISDGHIPKDKTLLFYAEKLKLEPSQLISTAYHQKAPQPMRHLFEPRAPIPKSAPPTRLAPVLGKAACGPWLASYEGEPDGYEPVESAGPDAFFVVAEGESMVGANIPPGALLLISPSSAVHNGNVVLAKRGEEEYTVKTYYKQAEGTTILQPMNPAFEPIVVPSREPLEVMRISEIRIKL